MHWYLKDNKRTFRARLDTTLTWEEISPVLKNRFRDEGYSIRKEEKNLLKLKKGKRKKTMMYSPIEFSTYLDFLLKGNILKVAFKYQDKIIINEQILSYLIVIFEELEHSLNNLEDVMVVKEGKISDNGTSFVNNEGKYLVKGLIDIKSKADPLYGWRGLPMIILPILAIVILVPQYFYDTSWIEVGIGFLPILILLLYVWMLERNLPVNVILKPDAIIIKYRRNEHQTTYDSIEFLSGHSSTFDFVIKYNYNGNRKKTAIGYEAAYRISMAIENRKVVDSLEKWMLPSWRKPKDGLSAGIPNRIRSGTESKAQGYQHYMLNDPLRTLILIKTEDDREILFDSARSHWDDSNYLEDLLNHAIYEAYDEEVITIGKRLFQLLPDNEKILKSTFWSLLKLKRIEEADEMIKNRIKDREPTSCEDLIISSIHEEKGMIEEALYHIGRAVEKNPNNLDALRTWISIVSSESGKAQTLSELDYLANQYSQAWRPPCALGEWLFTEGDYEKAESYLELAKKRGSSEEVIGIMSALYGNTGRLEDLIKVVENARKEGNVNITGLMNLAQAYMNLGSWRKAKNTLDHATKIASLEHLPIIHDMCLYLNEKDIG